jgi:hypothetical protein
MSTSSFNRKQKKYYVKGEIVAKEIVDGKQMYKIEFAREDWENSTVDEKGTKILIKQYEKKRMKNKCSLNVLHV